MSKSHTPDLYTSTDEFLDYCIVAFFIVIVISVIQWFVDGRKNFKGPQVELVGEDATGASFHDGYLDDKSRGMPEAEGNTVGEMSGEGRTAEMMGNGNAHEMDGRKEPAELNV